MAIPARWDSDDPTGHPTGHELDRTGMLTNRKRDGLKAGVSQQLSKVL